MSLVPSIAAAAAAVIELAHRHAVHLAAAESCSGGLVLAALTSVPGASAVVLGGSVVYANEAKMEWLGVPESLIARHGAVSEPVARAMAEGAAIAASHCVAEGAAVMSVAVTGIAGPSGGSVEKPVGTVHLAVQHRPSCRAWHRHCRFQGDRDAVRMQAVAVALEMLQEALCAMPETAAGAGR